MNKFSFTNSCEQFFVTKKVCTDFWPQFGDRGGGLLVLMAGCAGWCMYPAPFKTLLNNVMSHEAIFYFTPVLILGKFTVLFFV